MFIKLIQKGKTDLHSRRECTHYSALTTVGDPFIMQFMACHGDKDWEEILVDKREFIVYIESDSGKTVDKYAWVIDEKKNRAIRI